MKKLRCYSDKARDSLTRTIRVPDNTASKIGESRQVLLVQFALVTLRCFRSPWRQNKLGHQNRLCNNPKWADREHTQDIAFQHVQNYHFLSIKNQKIEIIPFFIHDIIATTYRLSLPAKTVQSDGTFIFNLLKTLHDGYYTDVEWTLFFR